MKQTKDWKLVTREHVICAIKRFVEERPEYPAARSTYLIYERKESTRQNTYAEWPIESFRN